MSIETGDGKLGLTDSERLVHGMREVFSSEVHSKNQIGKGYLEEMHGSPSLPDRRYEESRQLEREIHSEFVGLAGSHIVDGIRFVALPSSQEIDFLNRLEQLGRKAANLKSMGIARGVMKKLP